ncbi:unnamed protein product [Heligmosomoides polygyrus]|uniref:Ig-like domain-containing protein n=1 Tax=Heligmosomoides polygyrus TaxID=6339 RepID=A0A183GHW0_HELPZ|nr:unnamed protein product [Heligmosomoides polygyrus]
MNVSEKLTNAMHHHLLLALVFSVEAHRYYHMNDDELYFSKTDQGPRIARHSFFMQQFRLGYKLKLFCEAHGTPQPDLRWYKDGVEIRPRPGVRVRFCSFFVFHRLPGCGRSIQIRYVVDDDSVASHLDIDPARVLDAGEYECVANNSYGYHLQHIRAQVRL